MTYTQAMEYVQSLQPSGMKFGLERMQRILTLCGHPERRLRFVHVAGTNGKGSTSHMIQSILTVAGFRTGLFSSPAVTGLRDTITVDGSAIPEAEFAEITERLSHQQEQMGEVGTLSEFELTTALAFLHFASQHTDICVVECGLGGRDDATNVIPPPLAAVLTAISLDHTRILGESVEEIARQKCGIIKPPCSIITCPGQHEDALAVILETAADKGLTVRIPAVGGVEWLEQSPGRTVFVYDGIPICLRMTGSHQLGNALTAIETVRSLQTAGFLVSEEDIQNGLLAVTMPCRQEVLCTQPLMLLDGAHNPQGVHALADTLNRFGVRNSTLLMGMLADKDVKSCVEALMPYCRQIVCCTPDNPRALPAEDLARIANEISPQVAVQAIPSPQTAWDWVRGHHAGEPLVTGGSFYVASVLRDAMTAYARTACE